MKVAALVDLLRAPELRRFLLAGAFNTALSYALYVLFDRFLPYLVAYVLAYAVGVVAQFVLLHRYVYRVPARRTQALAYPLLHVAIAGFGSATLWLIVQLTGWPSAWAGLAAIAVQVPVAFVLTRWWFAGPGAAESAWRGFQVVAVAALLGGAALYVASGVAAVALFGFRRPLWDQFRSYQLLLSAPFPLDVLQAENGHRPIIPNLLKLADLAVDGGRQGVLLLAGTLFALVAFALIAGALWRDRVLPPLWRAAGVLAAALALFWLGNARMLLHGNESIGVYWVLAWLVCGVVALACGAGSTRATGVAALSLALGCFGFGNGPVIGCTLLLVAVLLRVPWRQVAGLAASFAVVLLLYSVLLPGAGAARNVLAVHPMENAAVALRWLSGAWIQVWLGLPDHPSGFMRAAMAHNGAGGWLIGSADWLARLADDPLSAQSGAALWLGAAGVAALLGLSVAAWQRREAAAATPVLGLGLAWFALGTAVLVGMSRLDYFAQWPRQIFAERYLPWSCAFWLGLLLAVPIGPRVAAATAPLAAVVVAVAAVALWPSERVWMGWAAIVDRHSRIFALALAQDQDLPALDAALAIPAEAATMRTIGDLRQAGSDLYDPHCPPPGTARGNVASLDVAWTDPADGLSSPSLRRLEGRWSGAPPDHARLWVRDGNGACIGRGEFTHYTSFGRRAGFDILARTAGAKPPLRVELVSADGTLLGARTLGAVP
jgi:putative flippase GtrA